MIHFNTRSLLESTAFVLVVYTISCFSMTIAPPFWAMLAASRSYSAVVMSWVQYMWPNYPPGWAAIVSNKISMASSRLADAVPNVVAVPNVFAEHAVAICLSLFTSVTGLHEAALHIWGSIRGIVHGIVLVYKLAHLVFRSPTADGIMAALAWPAITALYPCLRSLFRAVIRMARWMLLKITKAFSYLIIIIAVAVGLVVVAHARTVYL